jgi:hypothetical protein
LTISQNFSQIEDFFAVDKYREVMMSVEEHKEQLRTDELQQLHALHNLQEIIQLKPEGLVPTLRDSQLYQQVSCRHLIFMLVTT